MDLGTRITKLRLTAHLYAEAWRPKLATAWVFVTNTGKSAILTAQLLPGQLLTFMVDSTKFFINSPTTLVDEVLCGVSIAFMQVPESVAFAFIARVSPVRGMYSTFFIGLVAGIFNTLPGTVSGIAGGMVSIQQELTSDSGALSDLCLSERTEWLFATMVFCGLFQVVLGVFGLTRALKLVPHSVMVGFMNGLAIIIFRAQLSAFEADTDVSQVDTMDKICPPPDYSPPRAQRWLTFDEAQLWQVLIIVFLAMAIMVIQPRVNGRLQIGKFSIGANVIPSSLTAMIICTIITRFVYEDAFDSPIRTIGNFTSFPGNLPQPHIPQVPWNSGRFWKVSMPQAIMLAIVGLVETAMTWQMCQKIVGTKYPTYYCSYDCIGQGVGNLMASFFSSVGGSVMVGQTIVNLLNGSRSRVSTTMASFLILLFVSVAGSVIEMIPVAALTGILFVIVIKTFEWRTFIYIFRWSIPLTDVVAIVLVTALAVVTNLAIAVLIGVAWSAVVLSWKLSNATHILTKQEGKQTSVVKIDGPIFFGSAEKIIPDDKSQLGSMVILDLSNATVYDSSGIESLKGIVCDISSTSRQVYITGLDGRTLNLVARSRRLSAIVCNDFYIEDEELMERRTI
ncbi:hypothetical protein IWQ61_009360 [Dispira simplex]|nr:hypothetical protein IWQ61_009360 [Dispira simplex]